MPSLLDLLDLHVQTLYVLDSNGDIDTSNEPHVPHRTRGPAFHLGVCIEGYVTAYRDDISKLARGRIETTLEGLWPFAEQRAEPVVQKLTSLLADVAPVGRVGGGPAFSFPRDLDWLVGAVPIDEKNSSCLERHFPGSLPSLSHGHPCFAILEDGHAVSFCETVRRSPKSAEIGVDTAVQYRGKGYAPIVTSYWGHAVTDEGKTAFYSTEWGNAASLRVAEKLELVSVGGEYSIR